MTTKQAVSKAQAVRDYLDAHPAARSMEIASALNKQGIKITPSYVAEVKAKTAKTAAAETVVSPAVEMATDTLTAEQLRKVAQALKRIRSRMVANA